MKLWSVEGERRPNGWLWRGRGWSAQVYDIADPDQPREWVWSLNFPRYHALKALVGAVRRYGINVPGATTSPANSQRPREQRRKVPGRQGSDDRERGPKASDGRGPRRRLTHGSVSSSSGRPAGVSSVRRQRAGKRG